MWEMEQRGQVESNRSIDVQLGEGGGNQDEGEDGLIGESAYVEDNKDG
jgi:hypothetical protein